VSVPPHEKITSLDKGVSVTATASKIVVLGAGVCGLAAGMLLRRDGHEVTVLERDPAPVPGSSYQALERWARDGVTQFRQPHFLQPRGRIVLEEELPGVVRALEEAAGLWFDPLRLMPPSITDRAAREGDDHFKTITARRPVLEQVLGSAADAEPGLRVRRGIAVREPVVRTYNGVPHVAGVRTDAGEELHADLVVDAMGRRSQITSWLENAGASSVHEEVEGSGFVYYSRYFRRRSGPMPDFKAPFLTEVGTFSVLTLPADDDTWSVTLYISAGDKPLKRLRNTDAWTALVAACPLHAHWLDGDPISGVLPMAGVTDRYRRLTNGGGPIATGIVPVGDACACTNPSNGRGMSLGLMHIQRLRDVVRAHLDNPRELAEVWDAVTEAELTPWYRETVEEDRSRVREMEALRNGVELERHGGASAAARAALLAAVPCDPDAFRAFLRSRCCLTPLRDTLADQDFVDRILAVANDSEPPPLAGPNRAELLQILDRSPTAG
jgi:2-polyprenyl-6-methoxyphenol hydroxylase-like FAD-dependent oxidoreductase